jgi:hypothetical protein
MMHQTKACGLPGNRLCGQIPFNRAWPEDKRRVALAESERIVIRNIGNSQVVIGNGNTVISNISKEDAESNFEKLKQDIEKNVLPEPDKEFLLNAIKEMRENKENKEKRSKSFDKFLARTAQYTTIISPYIPFLSSFFEVKR